MKKLKVAFICGPCPLKLRQKLTPLASLEEISEIDIFSRHDIVGSSIPKTRWISMPQLFGSAHLQELWRLGLIFCKAGNYDLIIGCHQLWHGVWAWAAGKLWGKPVIQVVMTSTEFILGKSIPKAALMNASACAVRGEISAGILRRAGYTAEIRTLHNLMKLPVEKDQRAIEKTYDLISVAHYMDEKDFPTMFEVLRILSQARPGFKAALVGRGQEHLIGLRREKGLEANLEFLGVLKEEEVFELHGRAKAFLLTSKVEGLPMAVMEAMASGLPVFVTAAGELPWLVRDGVDGRILPIGDAYGIAKAVSSALETEQTLYSMGENARNRFTELSTEFTEQSISKAWTHIINAALKKGNDERNIETCHKPQ